ncbi:MAG: GspH/FimT family pseudopilin [Comamonadaceae bacterium]|nr:GspH/FimT family pseudopilin [Comamonadaceae bacterium]
MGRNVGHRCRGRRSGHARRAIISHPNCQRGSRPTPSALLSIFARSSEAIKRNSRVVLCTSSDGSTCVTSGGWQQGWTRFCGTPTMMRSGRLLQRN